MFYKLIYCRNTVFTGFLALSRAAGFLVIRGTEKDVEFWQSWPDSWLLRILSDKKGSTSNMADDIKSNSSNSPAGDDQIPKTTLIKSMELSPGSFWLSRIVILRAVSFIYGWFKTGVKYQNNHRVLQEARTYGWGHGREMVVYFPFLTLQVFHIYLHFYSFWFKNSIPLFPFNNTRFFYTTVKFKK